MLFFLFVLLRVQLYVLVYGKYECFVMQMLYAAMGSAVLFIFRSRLLLYSAGSGLQQSARCFVWI